MASASVVSIKSHVLNVPILHYDYSPNLLKFQSPGETIVDIDSFKQKLANSDHDFECLTPLNGGYVQFRFVDEFMGESIIWDAHLYTLAYYLYEVVNLSQSDASVHPFIHVGDMDKTMRKIEVCLNLPFIEAPAIVKTMVMIRQYKRLVIGRHEYGEKISIKG